MENLLGNYRWTACDNCGEVFIRVPGKDSPHTCRSNSNNNMISDLIMEKEKKEAVRLNDNQWNELVHRLLNKKFMLTKEQEQTIQKIAETLPNY